MSPAPGSRPNWAFDVVRLMRPHQWTKNVYVVAPLLFGELWLSGPAQLAVVVALGCFCLWSSSVYCLNDVIDAGNDRLHPRKRHRPVASGRVSPKAAVALALLLAAAGVLLAYRFLPTLFVGIGGMYLTNNLAYCLFLKHRVIADVLSIAVGFVLRLEAGCVAIGVEPTSWIHVCGFALALVLGFGKRRLEVFTAVQPNQHRRVMYRYTPGILDVLLGISASVCLLSYILYTVAPETIIRHQTNNLFYSVPFVAYGIFRFVLKTHEGGYDGPDEVLVRDPIFALNGVAWIVTCLLILHVG